MASTNLGFMASFLQRGVYSFMCIVHCVECKIDTARHNKTVQAEFVQLLRCKGYSVAVCDGAVAVSVIDVELQFNIFDGLNSVRFKIT